MVTGDLKQFDRIGDPTHVYPIFQYPFKRVLARHGFEIIDSWGFPTNGSSPTSRLGLRLLALLARVLGAKGVPAGDQLCLVLQRTDHELFGSSESKRAQVTAHYRRQEIDVLRLSACMRIAFGA